MRSLIIASGLLGLTLPDAEAGPALSRFAASQTTSVSATIAAEAPAYPDAAVEYSVDAVGNLADYLPPVQEETYNDGNYAIVEHKAEASLSKLQGVESTCPEGMKAMSAGFSAASSRGEPPGFRLTLSKPTEGGNGWVIYGEFDDSGDRLPADLEWQLRMSLVCLRVPQSQ